MKTFFAIVGILFAVQNVQAADAFDFKSLGFSKDGRYYAFVESVIQGGSGYPAARAMVVDVEKNLAVEYDFTVIEEENGPLDEAVRQALGNVHLSKYGIDGKQNGTTLWVRLPTDLDQPNLKPLFSTAYGVDGGASGVWPKYRLHVSESPKNPKACLGNGASLLTVRLANLEKSAKLKLLQKDQSLPESRACALNYQPRQIIMNGDAIVVVVRFESFGFEGPDYQHMVVTAKNVFN